MKILFVDIDDVLLMHDGSIVPYPHELNSIDNYIACMRYYSDKFNQAHINRLKRLIEQNVKIVIHSSWRNYLDLKDFKEIFSFYEINPDNIIGVCPVFFGQSKKRGIESFLSEKKDITHHAVIDDDTGLNVPNIVLINPSLGFNEDAYIQVKKLLSL